MIKEPGGRLAVLAGKKAGAKVLRPHLEGRASVAVWKLLQEMGSEVCLCLNPGCLLEQPFSFWCLVNVPLGGHRAGHSSGNAGSHGWGQCDSEGVSSLGQGLPP